MGKVSDTHSAGSLVLMIGTGGLCYVIRPSDGAKLSAGRCHLETAGNGSVSLRDLNSAVYGIDEGSRCIAGDYDSVTCCVDTERYMLLPPQLADEGAARDLAASLWPADDIAVEIAPVDGSSCSIAFAMPKDMASYLRRTFPEIKFCHRLNPVINALLNGTSCDCRRKACCFISGKGDHADYAVGIDGSLALAGSSVIRTMSDAVYFVEAAFDGNTPDDRVQRPESVVFLSSSPKDFISFKTVASGADPAMSVVPLLSMSPDIGGDISSDDLPQSLKLLIS